MQEVDGRTGIAYTDLDGTARLLDCTDVIPDDPAERHSFMIPHIAQALRNEDLDYITWAIKAQELAGAHIIDLCVDEMSVYPEERYEWIKSLVRTAQVDHRLRRRHRFVGLQDDLRRGSKPTTARRAAPPSTRSTSRTAARSWSGWQRERDAILFANASGNTGMPQNADERVANLTRCMEMMDDGGIPMEDRFLDALVFPVGAGSGVRGPLPRRGAGAAREVPGRAHLRRAQQRLFRTAEPQAPQPDVRHPLDPGRLRRRDESIR